MAKIVAGSVGAIFGELLAETKVARAVQACHETIHHGLGDQIEARDAGENGGIKEALFHVFRRFSDGLQTIPHFRRSHHSEKRSSTSTRKTSGKSHRSLVSRTVTPASEKGMPLASLPRSAGFQYCPPV